MPDVFGLTESQFDQLGELVQRSGVVVRPESPSPVRRGAPSEFVRVMTLDYPEYSPREPRSCALFEHDPDAVTVTARFFGESLAGDVLLNFNGVIYRTDCRATTAELRSRLNLPLNYCRVTVFPGLWEFAFTDPAVIRTQTPPLIAVDGYLTGAAVRFLGGVIVTREGWRSATEDGDTFAKVPVIDAVPFRRGAVKAGAVALAQRYGAEQFMVTNWSCPEFSFKST